MPSFWLIRGPLHRYCPKPIEDCVYCQFFKLMQPPEPGKERTWWQIWAAFKLYSRENYDKRFKNPPPPKTPTPSEPESSICALDDLQEVEPVLYRVCAPEGADVREGIELDTPSVAQLDPGAVMSVSDVRQTERTKVVRLKTEQGWISEEYDTLEGHRGPVC